MEQETRYKETVQELEEKLDRKLTEEEITLLCDLFKIENPSND
ncbi:hypothetical protein ACTHQ4_20000 [Alkalicoccobacillus gibsonii]